MIKKPVSENRKLYLDELSGIHMSAERMDSVISFMVQADLVSLRDIEDTDILCFRNVYLKKAGLWDRLAFFQDALEETRNWGVRKDAEALLAFYTSALPFTVFAKRACYYLAAHGVSSPEEIGYPVRASLEKYLQAISYVCIPSVLSAVDRMKIEAMRRDYERRKVPLQKSYPQKDELFLLYDAGYPQAKILYPTSDKTSLYYDLTVLSSNRIRAQFRELLFFALDLPIEPLKLRSYYIQPLRLLYETACQLRWDDLETLTEEDEVFFNNYADTYYGSVLKWHHQILYKVRRHLFLSSDEINWNATVWFMERLHLAPYRISPSNSIRTFHFTMYKDPEVRYLFQLYMKYLLGITDRSLSTIKSHYKDLAIFLSFMERHGFSVPTLSRVQFEEFLNEIEEDRSYGLRPFNQLCEHIHCFYLFLSVQKLSEPLYFKPGSYMKSLLPEHHNRSVPATVIAQTLEKLYLFPEDLRLMYLHLLATGLRISEVCTIRVKDYSKNAEDCWLRIYQHKMKAEKRIPIPSALYELMHDFIEKAKLSSEDYVFCNTKGGPYVSGTFRAKMKKYCDMYGINTDNYTFRSHDFRHTIATYCFENGMSIPSIRDFLGHSSSEMTKEYIDYIPKMIEEKSIEYFKTHPWTKGKGYE